MGRDLPSKYKPLRKAVALVLQDKPGVLYDADRLSSVINGAAGVDSHNDIAARIGNRMLVDAFCNSAGGSEYSLEYCNLNIDGCEDDTHVLHVRLSDQEERSGARTSAFGRFASSEEGRAASVVGTVAGRRHARLPEDVVAGLLKLLRAEAALQKKRAERPAADVTPTTGGGASGSEDTGASKRQRTIAAEKAKLQAQLDRQLALIRETIEEATASRMQLMRLEREENEERAEGAEGETGTGPEAPVGVGPSATVKDGTKLQYILEGRAGEITLGKSGIVFTDQLVYGLVELPYEDSEEARQKREEQEYVLENGTYNQSWKVKGSTVIRSNHLSRIRNKCAIVDAFKELFKGERCKFSERAMNYITAFSMHNLGGSDGGAEMLIYATVTAICMDIGLEISPAALAKGCPSQSHLRNYEFRFGAGCFLMECFEMRFVHRTVHCNLGLDHGHRNHIDALVKVLHYAVIDDNGNRYIKDFCIDIDACGHTKEEVVEGVGTSFGMVLRFVPQLKLAGITGDSGGGGAVQTIHPLLVDAKIMEPWSRFIQCFMHGLQKCMQRACEATFGQQGMGQHTCLQLIYQAATVLRRVKEVGGLQFYDAIHKRVVTAIREREDWQEELKRKCPERYEYFLKEKIDCEQTADILKGHVEGQRNVQLPVWTRWLSSMICARYLLENWVEVRFTGVALRQTEDLKNGSTSSYLKTTSTDMLQMMNTFATNEDGTDSDVPSYQAQLMLMVAFDDAFVSNFFDLAMRADPEFGRGSHGKTSRLCPERIYLGKKAIQSLRNGGWRTHAAFQGYCDVILGIPFLGDVTNGGREWFEQAPETFLAEFETTWDSMLEKESWRSTKKSNANKLVPYAIGGDKRICKELLKWLAHADEVGNVEGYQFPSAQVELANHDANNGTVTVDLRECLEYITSGADPLEILKDPLITRQKDLLWEMAAADEVVDVFDSLTWGEGLYTPVLDLVQEMIVAHPCNNQLIENYVQTHANIAKTGVHEPRRTVRALIHSSTLRPYNRISLAEKRESIEDPKLREQFKRVRGKERTEGFSLFIENVCDNIELARDAFGNDVLSALVEEMKSGNKKTSAAEHAKKVALVEKGIARKRNNTAGEQSKEGIHVTPQMGGNILLSVLLKGEGDEPIVDAEILAREIDVTNEPLSKMEWKDKKNRLKMDEMQRLVLGDRPNTIDHWSKINQIKPVSDELKAFHPTQQQRLLAKQNKK